MQLSHVSTQTLSRLHLYVFAHRLQGIVKKIQMLIGAGRIATTIA